MNRTNVARVERWCVNIPFGIYMGWITVVLSNLGWNGLGISPEIWTALLLAVGITGVDFAYIVTVVWA